MMPGIGVQLRAESLFTFGRNGCSRSSGIRIQAEGRAVGDYLGWDYRLPGDAMQRVFEIAMRAFYERNFSDGSAPHRLMGTRFMVEIARHFHPGRFDARWLADAKALTRRLTLDSVGALEEIVSFVTGNEDRGEDEVFAARLAVRLRAEERVLHEEAARLEASMEGGLR